ncbi:transcriptional regulator [Streptomyces sp. NPDC001401]|uniref:transcriptional regulator n=1 Tax=Streptomyces sp. NPDC001401 TaxID=3364570 RepID=UPI0036B87F5B
MDATQVNGNGPMLVEAFLQPTRLRIAAALSVCCSAAFPQVRERLDISDSLLSKHVAILRKQGLVTVSKAMNGTMPRTTLALTREGRQAFTNHLAMLTKMADEAKMADDTAGSTEEMADEAAVPAEDSPSLIQ